MDNIRDSLEILFSKTNPEEVIRTFFEEVPPYNDMSKQISKEPFVTLSEILENGKTKDELEVVHSIVNDDWSKSHKEDGLRKDKPQQSVFYILYNFVKDVLCEKEEKPVCEFSQLLRWRDITYKLGEDVFTTVYFAKNDLSSKRERHYFSWLPTISTNNYYLREILKKGVADIHFHLKGSSLNFDLSWLSLMNHIIGRKDVFLKIKNSKQPNANPWFDNSQLSLYALCVKAFAIRQMFFRILIKDSSFQSKDKDINILNALYLPAIQSKTEEELLYYTYDLQKEVNILSHIHGKKYGDNFVDYAIRKNLSDKNYDPDSYHNSVLWGERWLMYKMFKCIFAGEQKRAFYAPLFYAYLIIKIQFRRELIQVNSYPGFRNFQDYQDRKSYFIDNKPIYKELLVNLAINNTLYGQHVDYLEARIAPENKLKNNLDLLNWLDKIVYEKMALPICDDFPKLKYVDKRDSYYYIFHFIKKPDKIDYSEETIGLVIPRHHKLREEIKEQAMAINLLRRQKSSTKERLAGVDAASSEIGCRPEIFAQAYRYLKMYSIELESHFFDNTSLLHLGYTYHVGEDFLDIADGLRAIDEVVKFLNFGGGDRLGHALALGISPERYYEQKKYRIILPKQDLLDNIVWLLMQIKIYNISISQSLVFELEGMYNYLFQEIYSGATQDSYVSAQIYYYSWLLRGDNPSLCFSSDKKNKFGGYKNFNPITFWEKCGANGLSECERAQQNASAIHLYQSYHYNADVKRIGAEYCEYKINKDYIKLIRDIQNGMMWSLAKKHIAIETNPTSNKLIRQLNYYSDHPLARFFNLGLTYNTNEISSSPQISVSINTDDLGVFATSIENEYALMAIAMEKETDENGKPKYTSRMIYDWLDRIRSMGFEQRFKNNRDMINNNMNIMKPNLFKF